MEWKRCDPVGWATVANNQFLQKEYWMHLDQKTGWTRLSLQNIGAQNYLRGKTELNKKVNAGNIVCKMYVLLGFTEW